MGVGSGVLVGRGVAVGSGVLVGRGVAVGSGVLVGRGVAVGSGVLVGRGVAVGSVAGIGVGWGVSVGSETSAGLGVARGSAVSIALGATVATSWDVGCGVVRVGFCGIRVATEESEQATIASKANNGPTMANKHFNTRNTFRCLSRFRMNPQPCWPGGRADYNSVIPGAVKLIARTPRQSAERGCPTVWMVMPFEKG